MTEEEKQELEFLLMELTEGELSSEQGNLLMEMIRQHSEAKQQYLEYCQMHTMLSWEHGVLGDLGLSGAPEKKESSPRYFSYIKPLVMVASFALVGLAIWFKWTIPQKMKPGETVATLTRSVAGSLQLDGVSGKLSHNSSIRTGRYQLEEGLIQINFESGAEVVIQAPASFEIHSSDFVRLSDGRLAANVPPEGVGFTVDTPDAEVVDYGTEFAVEVIGEDGCEVHVFNGEVKVKPKQQDSSIEPVHLVTDQAIRIDHSTLIPHGISVDNQRFLRKLDEPEPTYSLGVRELLPIAYYRMSVVDDGQSLKDVAKGHRNMARLINVDWSRQTFAPGRIGSSLRLGGPKRGVYANVSSGLELSASEFTIMAWVWAKTFPKNAILVSDMNLPGTETFRFGFIGNHGHLGLILSNGEQFLQIVDSSPLSQEKWEHVAVVKSVEGLRLHKNGELVSSTPLNGFLCQQFKPSFIGGLPKKSGDKKRDSRTGFWHGRIDELAFFGSALTREQIENLFNLTPPI